MTINVPPTQEHQALAAAVNARMAADSRIVNAKAALLRLAGVGVLMALTGVGVAAGLFGWSLVKDERPSVDRIADAMVRALDRTTLKTSGEVRMADDARVKLESEGLRLASDAAVKVETNLKLDPNTTVKLEPNATVRVAAPPETPRPTAEQLKPEQTTPGGSKPVTNYTIFKNVALGQGKVVTGWTFSSSDQTTPSSQYCYYAEPGGGDSTVEVTTYIAQDGRRLANVKARSFDPAAAVRSCVWFDGAATRPM
jgi:hypothetical protein